MRSVQGRRGLGVELPAVLNTVCYNESRSSRANTGSRRVPNAAEDVPE